MSKILSTLSSLFTYPSDSGKTEEELVSARYLYWRVRIFYSMYMGYAFFYFTRKSFTFAIPAMMHSLNMTKAELGILGSILYITYGLSKFISGVASDRSNPRYFMGIGLMLTGAVNILFGCSSSIVLLALFAGLNGWFQGWGWPPCARLLTHWYAQNERGRWWSFWNTSHNVGGALIPVLVAFFIQLAGWRVAMYIPGTLAIVMGLFLINRLRDTPESLGLPTIEDHMQSPSANASAIDKLSYKEILWDHVLKNPYMWILGIAYLFVYITRTVINDWSLPFLYEYKGLTLISASTCIVSFEIGGLLGSLSAGWLSDTWFGGRRGPVNVLYSMLASVVVGFLWMTPVGNVWVANLLLGLIGFFIFGPQMLIGIAAAELSHKKAAGTATGFVGWFAYTGAALAGFPFGLIATEWGWDAMLATLIVCSSVAWLILLPLWSLASRTDTKAST